MRRAALIVLAVAFTAAGCFTPVTKRAAVVPVPVAVMGPALPWTLWCDGSKPICFCPGACQRLGLRHRPERIYAKDGQGASCGCVG